MRTGRGKISTKGLRAGLVGAFLTSTAGVARADDVFSFFQNAFGGGAVRHAELPPDNPGYDYDTPPLTVRRHPRRRVSYAAPERTPQQVLEDSKDVTIYTDRTLARGDVVMTARGLRVFNGSESWPYTDEDFVEVSAKARIAPDMRRELHSIDAASRIASGY